MKPMRLAPVFCFSILLAALLTVLPPPLTADTTVGGTISMDTTWTVAGSPYIVTSNITVQGIDGADEITTLTIEPGVTVKFNPYRYLNVGAASGNSGALVAQGTTGQPIIFTSNAASPAPGNWYGIRFYATAAATVLENCAIRYAGYYNQRSLSIENAAPTITSTTIENGLGYDLYFSGTVGGTVSDCTLNNGISLLATSTVDFSGNTFNYNAGFPIKTYADNVHSLVNGNTFTNLSDDSVIEVTSGTITKDATWRDVIPYLISYSPLIQGTDGADGVTTLTLEPGVELRFNNNLALNVGATSGAPGALSAQGTAEAPIVFTSSAATPAPGKWVGVWFNDTSYETASLMEYCVLEFAGYYYNRGISINNADTQIRNCIVRYTKGSGLYVTGLQSSAANIHCNSFTNNGNGIYTISDATPTVQSNNFIYNTGYGIYNASSTALIAEDNWWGDVNGPNGAGDTTGGNIDAEPWSLAENDCSGISENYPPFAPSAPVPSEGQVRIESENGVSLSWTCGDPNSGDSLTYDLYWGTAPDGMQILSQSISQSAYQTGPLPRGITYYWQIIAKDSGGLETAGPIWFFTTEGDPPDLIISQISTRPAGGMQPYSWVSLTATVTNNGPGPVVDGFAIGFTVDGIQLGSVASDRILAPGASTQVLQNWYYPGGDPTITVIADNQANVNETDETNNQLERKLSSMADIIAPTMTANTPANGAQLQQIQQISVTLADGQSAIDDTAVMAGFTVADAMQQPMEGTVSESNDTFIFVPDSLPLPDGLYNVAVTAVDIHGNSRSLSFDFTIDTVPPAKPSITGGTVASGTIQARPAQNTAERVIATLKGTREDNSGVWVNDVQYLPPGSGPWSFQIKLTPGGNSFEVFCKDPAGNRSESEWVDIELSSDSGLVYEYDASGRMKSVITMHPQQ